MAAVAHSIKAIRALSRWGATEVVERAFAGFTALPAGDGSDISMSVAWRNVFDINPEFEAVLPKADLLSVVRYRHREKAKYLHPDVGGTTEAMMMVNAALEAAEAELTK